MIRQWLTRIFGLRRRTSPAGGGPRYAFGGRGQRGTRPEAEADERPASPAPAVDDPARLCDIREGMPPEEIRQRLAALYRRHNRAAASLDPELRREAEMMLDAIVQCRERYLGTGPAPR